MYGRKRVGLIVHGSHISTSYDNNLFMRLWVLNHYADPPDGMATRTFDIARRLVEQGNAATVFASNFSHYRFARMRPIPWGRLWKTEVIDGVEFVWIQTTRYRLNDWARIVNMASFAVVAVIAGLLRAERPDVVIGVTVHPLAALAGYWLSKAKRARFLLEVTDLWPQTLVDLGRLAPDSETVRWLRRLERFLFRRAERILMLWRNTDSYVESQGVSAEKILWLPHGVELSRYEHLEAYTGVPAKGLFQVVYLGAFVESMALETILEAARLLKAKGRSDIRFRLIGAGTYRNQIMARAVELHLDTVEFPPPVPKAQIAQAMTGADAFIYGLRDVTLYKYGMSLNKVTDYLAGARPIIYYGRSTYDPVSEAQAGFTVPPGDPQAVAAAIERLVELTAAERIAMGKRGRAYLEQHHTIAVITNRLVKALSSS